MNSLQSSEYPTRAIIDLGAFRHNLSSVRKYVGTSVKMMAVVKANGYGHGMAEVARAAVAWGVDYLAVARMHEGVELRTTGILHPTLVFEALSVSSLDTALRNSLEVTIVDVPTAVALSARAQSLGGRVKVHVKVDTGMGRLGISHQHAADAIASIAGLPAIDVVGVYSHFATSEDEDQRFAEEQIARFRAVLDHLTSRGLTIPLRHMANSGAIISLPGALFDMVRPGIMLYGYTPGNMMTERFPVRPVLSLKSKVAFLKTVAPGTSISYGRRYFTTEPTTIATVPAGYADGFSRLLTNKAEALVRGKRYPVVGTICMDQLMVDLGKDPEVIVGDDVTLIGRDGEEVITAWDTAARIGTIPYEVTCLITERVHRVYEE